MKVEFFAVILISLSSLTSAFFWRYHNKNLRNAIFSDYHQYSSILTASDHVSEQDDSEDLYFSQKLDNFNNKDKTVWNQTTFYEKNGPIFIFIGGESPIEKKWMQGGKWMELAEELKAICFILEHRYYGKSRPKHDTSTDNLKYLTTPQALADIAHFITGIKKLHNLPENSKVILFGGSYAGNLVAWTRMKYPHLVYGAVSSSAPVLAKVDFSEYFETIKKSLNSHSPECVSNLVDVHDQLAKLLQTDFGRKQIRNTFKICEAIDSRKTDLISVIELLADINIAYLVQYNDTWRRLTENKISIAKFCEIMNQPGKTLLKRYAKFNTMMQKLMGVSCWSHEYTETLRYYSNINYDKEDQSNRLWLYQTCTEYGYYQISDQPEHLFGNNIPLNFFLNLCSDVFEPRFDRDSIENSVKRTNAEYKGLKFNASNVIFVHGTFDPWHSLGILKKEKNSLFDVFLINGASHCSDMYSSSDEDEKHRKDVSEQISKIVRSWVHQK